MMILQIPGLVQAVLANQANQQNQTPAAQGRGFFGDIFGAISDPVLGALITAIAGGITGGFTAEAEKEAAEAAAEATLEATGISAEAQKEIAAEQREIDRLKAALQELNIRRQEQATRAALAQRGGEAIAQAQLTAAQQRGQAGERVGRQAQQTAANIIQALGVRR